VSLSLNVLKCCLLTAACEAMSAEGLDVPDLVYPSACGDAPICLTASYMTVYLAPPGIEEEEGGGRSVRRVAHVRITVGLPQVVTWQDLDCTAVTGDCCDPEPGTYAFESLRNDRYLEVLTRLGSAWAACLCGDEQGSCSRPVLVESSTDCNAARPALSATYRVAFG
jgi:hypothetical protein